MDSAQNLNFMVRVLKHTCCMRASVRSVQQNQLDEKLKNSQQALVDLRWKAVGGGGGTGEEEQGLKLRMVTEGTGVSRGGILRSSCASLSPTPWT